jgi:hypothetical protein
MPSYPHLNDNDDLVIPFDCDEFYHYWKPGTKLSVRKILAKIKVANEKKLEEELGKENGDQILIAKIQSRLSNWNAIQSRYENNDYDLT